MTVLVVAAHPDDEVLGCGGTISRLTQEGQQVYVAILGEGITSRYAQRGDADSRLVERLHNCSRRVAEMIGVTKLFMYSLPDNRFDTVPLLDIIKIVDDLIDKLNPSIVYTHHAGDLNIDHSLLSRAVLTATRPLPGSSVRSVYTFEVLSSTEWSFQYLQPTFRANTFVDIEKHIGVKIDAMKMYEEEARPFPHPRSSETLRANATRWGSTVGLHAAEAFELIRDIS